MKSKRATQRSFPGRLTLEEWIALPGFARRDMVHRAACAVLHCHRLCAGKPCRRHRACCADDAAACKARLWQRAKWHPMTLRREFSRLGILAGLGGTDRKTGPEAATCFARAAGLNDSWHAPELFPGETQRFVRERDCLSAPAIAGEGDHTKCGGGGAGGEGHSDVSGASVDASAPPTAQERGPPSPLSWGGMKVGLQSGGEFL